MKKYFLTICLSLFPLLTTFGQQFPPIGIIDFYGLRTISEKDVWSVLNIKVGDDAIETIKSAEEIRQTLKKLPNVEDASISLICCDDIFGKSIIFVGIREKGIPALKFNTAPTGKIRLPKIIAQAGKDFQTAFAQALAEKDFSEDDSQGHALFGNQNVRKVQERFVTLANEHLKVLQQVLRKSSDAEQRATAAQIIAYARNKKAIVSDLIFAVNDDNEHVRNNAIRALIVIANYAIANPSLKIKIPADDFIPMLNSLEWTDRNKALGVLDALAKNRDGRLLAKLKNNALDSLIEMARWKSPGHAQTAFSILGRIGKLSEVQIEKAWKTGDREQEIKRILDSIKNL
ncbi:MAG TPA: HEAT repeat domain-containing protein [Pyrinomonadaceae bacterium]|nr:HEAT repeat domain-containing protein [Pyrinomonadaceae bacterium]